MFQPLRICGWILTGFRQFSERGGSRGREPSDIVTVDLAFGTTCSNETGHGKTCSNKIGHGKTLGRPFQGFRVPTKILWGPGCRFYTWFFNLIINLIPFSKKTHKIHACIVQKSCFSVIKSPRQGCTTQKTQLGMHQSPKSLKIIKNHVCYKKLCWRPSWGCTKVRHHWKLWKIMCVIKSYVFLYQKPPAGLHHRRPNAPEPPFSFRSLIGWWGGKGVSKSWDHQKYDANLFKYNHYINRLWCDRKYERTPAVDWRNHFRRGGVRLRNSDGWSEVQGRRFWTRSLMGQLWYDLFRHLGHPPKSIGPRMSVLFWVCSLGSMIENDSPVLA